MGGVCSKSDDQVGGGARRERNQGNFSEISSQPTAVQKKSVSSKVLILGEPKVGKTSLV